MKLFGSKKKARHVKQNKNNKPSGKSGATRKKSMGKGVKIAIGILVVVTALGFASLAYLKLSASAPPVKQAPTTPKADNEPDDGIVTPDPDKPDVEPTGIRNPDKFTFVIFGTDDGNGNTDVIMVATLDRKDYSLNVVNIPRDTLVNVSWNTKKVNSLYSAMKGADGAIEKLSDVLGFEVDFYVVVDLEAFSALVDAIGGVNFDVPRSMDYDDPAQDLHIHIKKGPQTLNGKNALKLVRFRNYPSGDIGRIEMTQQFLGTAAEQILANKKSISLQSMASIFLKYVDTNLKLNELIWLGGEMFKLDSQNIDFSLMPGNYLDSIGGLSYVTIYVDEWLEVINEKLNPFTVPITLENLSIYTRNSSGKLYVTNGVYAGRESWGNSSGQSKPKPTPTPTPAPTATPTPTPTPSATPTPSPGDETPVTPDVTETPIPSTVPEIPEETPTAPPVIETPETTLPPATPPDDGLFYTGNF